MQETKDPVGTLNWEELIKKAKNRLWQEKTGQSVKTVEIKVKEVLTVGYWYRGQGAVAIVRDEKGKIWILPESGTLFSRRDVKEGMKLRLKITEKNYLGQQTEVFVFK